MLVMARFLRERNIPCTFAFFEGGIRLRELEAVGTVFVGSPEEIVKLVRHTDSFDVVQVWADEALSDMAICLGLTDRLFVTATTGIGWGWTSRTAAGYSAISSPLARVCQRYTDLPVTVIPGGVDLSKFVARETAVGPPPIVAWVGRVSDDLQKDFSRFVRIARILVGRGFRMWVADASRSSRDAVGERLGPLPIEKWLSLTADQMSDFYSGVADSGGCLLLTSRTEAWGLVATEAAACGLTCVAPKVLGLRDSVIPEVTGCHFPSTASDSEVAQLVEEWVSKGQQLTRRRRDCADAARRFSADYMVDRYLAFWQGTTTFAGFPTADDIGDPATPMLAARLSASRWRRAHYLAEAAESLALQRHHGLARRALFRVFQLRPTYLLRPSRLLRVLRSLMSAD